MALIRCPECNNEVSDRASICPHCGYPMSERIDSKSNSSNNGDRIILCPNCGAENSSNVLCCKYCGESYNTKTWIVKPKMLPPNDIPKMFNCYKCGRKIPIESNECVFCGIKYGNAKDCNVSSEQSIRCPSCGSYKIRKVSKKPTFIKIIEVAAMGGILPDAGGQYDVEFRCKNCGKTWTHQ